MTMDSLIPLVGLIGWLVLAGSAIASFRLGWSQMLRLALAWLAIFGGLFLAVGWFLAARGSAAALL